MIKKYSFYGIHWAYSPNETHDEVWLGNLAVGHFSRKPWWDYHERFAAPLAKIGCVQIW
jgi:hypothetical protein